VNFIGEWYPSTENFCIPASTIGYRLRLTVRLRSLLRESFDMKPMLLAAITMLLNHAALAADAPAPAYGVAGSIALGDGERWDYVTYDPVDHRAYVAHGDHVSVVDTAKQMLVGDIGTFPGGTHGIAIVHDADVGYTDDAKTGEVIAFDLRTLQVTKKIKGDEDADGIVYDTASKHVFVINGDRAEERIVTTGQQLDSQIEIATGLKAGEKVATKNVAQLFDGAKVS